MAINIGDEVVCIRGYASKGCVLKTGRLYIVLDMIECSCGTISLYVGLNPPMAEIFGTLCCSCNATIDEHRWVHDINRFIKLEPKRKSNAVTRELIKIEIVEERSDAPKKETETA